jgi:hypothetical protein
MFFIQINAEQKMHSRDQNIPLSDSLNVLLGNITDIGDKNDEKEDGKTTKLIIDIKIHISIVTLRQMLTDNAIAIKDRYRTYKFHNALRAFLFNKAKTQQQYEASRPLAPTTILFQLKVLRSSDPFPSPGDIQIRYFSPFATDFYRL